MNGMPGVRPVLTVRNINDKEHLTFHKLTETISIKRKLFYISLAWVVMIGIDFLFHASLFASFWKEDLPALKSLNDLALLIPAGYLSFFFLTVLIGYVHFLVFKTPPVRKKVVGFGFVFALLFSLSNFLGLYSYIDLPLKQLILFNAVYFVEIVAVCLCLYYFSGLRHWKKALMHTVFIFLGLVIIGIIIQNIFSYS